MNVLTGFDYALLLAVPLIPLVGYVLQIAFRKKLPFGDKILTFGMFAVMCITVRMAFKAILHDYSVEPFFNESATVEGKSWVFKWLFRDLAWDHDLNISAGILYDSLGAVLLGVVGIVSFCVHLFSTGYMHGDKRYNIFFANISLFTFAMLALVLSDNIFFFFVFWEVMGLMSYQLIGHFSHDDSNPYFHRWSQWACKKAFLTTRVGDCCLLVGILMFYAWTDPVLGKSCGSFRFTDMWAHAQAVVEANGGAFPTWMTVAGLFAFGGTVGKSAQFPLHIWLPDAMAGPTPVSAMIHAATMVAAGVFLLGRLFPMMSPEVLMVVTVIGAFTALFAATIGMTAYDLKAVLAWSTISQLGFMVAAVGLGGVVAGMFHMVTHAFFKACLFLSAGSVIHGCHHEQDMRRMGGLRKHMPITFACMLICTLAIAGVPLFSGFYSKDMILMAGWVNLLDSKPAGMGWHVFATVALSLAAIMTAFYMFRMVFITFFGTYRGEIAEGHGHGHDDHHDDHHHEEIVHAEDGGIAHGHPGPMPHESPWPMTVALCILAFLGFLGGDFWILDSHFYAIWHPETWFEGMASLKGFYPNIGDDLVGDWMHSRFEPEPAVLSAAHHKAFLSSVLFIAPAGILLAVFLYLWKKELPGKITRGLGLVYETVRDRYYVDEFVDATVIKPTMALTTVAKTFDGKIIDGLVNLVGAANRAFAALCALFDKVVVDGLVNLVAMVSQAFGAASRLLQTGRVQQYAAFAVGGSLLAAAWLILS